jgi:hypothetical protein
VSRFVTECSRPEDFQLRRQQLPHRPRLPGQPRLHSRSHPDRRVHPSEVVGREVQRQGGAQVVPLPAESIRQAGKAPHLHPDVQVRPLNMGCADALLRRRSGDDHLLGAYYRGGRVAALGIDRLRPDSPTEMLLDGGGVGVPHFASQAPAWHPPRCAPQKGEDGRGGPIYGGIRRFGGQT